MSDDGYNGGDYDYESGPGCVNKKISISYFINHAVLNLRFNDGAFVCFFFCSVKIFLVGRRS